MPSANGHGPNRAILYARVSTDEQARSGYSLAQQIEALRVYASREGYEVLEEVSDPGQSGASLERPGMARVRDLVAGGGVSVVLAQDRDRFAREPAYLYLLKQEFAERGTSIRALNDRGDESPEGQLTDGILDQLAKFERAKTAERTRRGKLQKAREGKVLALGMADYGFRYNDARDNYIVDEGAMRIVRRIIHMVGVEGRTLHETRKVLEKVGLPTPTGNKHWSSTFVRECVLDDVYKPHTFEEVKALVSPEVAARLDPEKHYGIWWYNRRRMRYRQVAEEGPDGRYYRRRGRSEWKDESEWVAVPVPDPGIPREWVDAARDAIRDNRSTASSAGGRFWELSGGVLLCGGCGRRMQTDRSRRTRGADWHHYYRCSKRAQHGAEACPQRKKRRADEVEPLVWRFVCGLLTDPERLRADLDVMIEQERADMRGDPERETKAWLDKLAEVERKRSGYLDLAAEGIMGREELRTKLAALEETRETARHELEELRGRCQRVEELERDRDALLDDLVDVVPDALDALTSEERHRFYKMLRLKVILHPDGTMEASGAFGEDLGVSISDTKSRSRARPLCAG